jgi:hypothetical protein
MDLLFSMLLCATWILIAFFLVVIRRGSSDALIFWSTTTLGLATVALSMFRFTRVLKIGSLLNGADDLRKQNKKDEEEHDPPA